MFRWVIEVFVKGFIQIVSIEVPEVVAWELQLRCIAFDFAEKEDMSILLQK